MSIYPLTVITDRYQGVYSGGEYIAINIGFNCMNRFEDMAAHDRAAYNFWGLIKKGAVFFNSFEERIFFGKGKTAQAAILHLKVQLKEYNDEKRD